MKFHARDRDATTPAGMTEWLHRTVPLSAAMGVRVLHLEEGRATLTMPLAPNVNHMGTVFGGSLNALGLLTAAAAALTRLRRDGYEHQLAVRRSEYDYHRPAPSAPTATAEVTAPQWSQIKPALQAQKPARLKIEANITTQNHPTGTLKAHFTLLPPPLPEPRGL